MKTRKLTIAIISIFVSAIMFAFASCVETVEENVVPDTLDSSVTEVTSENDGAVQAQDNADAEVVETPAEEADQPVIAE